MGSAEVRKEDVSTVEPSLSALSLMAAIQLDRLMRNHSADVAVVGRLAKALEDMPGVKAESNALNLHADPLAVDIFSKALHDISGGPIRDLMELESQITSLIQTMADTKALSAKADVPRMKAFCLSLHHALLSENEEIYESDETTVTDELESG